jgi:cytochrome c peroxidase
MRVGRTFVGLIVLGIWLGIWTAGGSAGAQEPPPSIPHWAAVAHQAARKVHTDNFPDGATGIFPPVIPQRLPSSDPDGAVETDNLAAPTFTRNHPFFQSLGSNGRACATCHEPRSAWGVSAASIQQRFEASGGTDPIFRVVDGATCNTDDVGSFSARRKAYSLLLSQGLIRVFLPLPDSQLASNPPAPRDFEIAAISDPYGCTDLSATPAIVSVYRRPLPSANLPFLTECPQSNPACAHLSIMWDGREPSFESQAVDATLIHAQGANPPTSAQVTQIVDFETQIFDAQVFDDDAGYLGADGASGGPVALSQQPFFIGINDSLSAGFNDNVFSLYTAWQNLTHSNDHSRHRSSHGFHNHDAARESIARGENIFNTRQFTISGVNGLNLLSSDPLGATPLTTGTCTICHDSPNVGNHSKILPLNIGVADADPPVLNVAALPVFTVNCTDTTGPLAGQSFTVTDLGRALITGKCADVGKVKGPILRGLAARAPYFHNGSAASLDDVVNFYDQRFAIGFTNQEKADLIAFLETL